MSDFTSLLDAVRSGLGLGDQPIEVWKAKSGSAATSVGDLAPKAKVEVREPAG